MYTSKTSINGKKTKTMHAKSASAEHAHALSILPVVSASCPVHELSSPRDDQSASHPVRKLAYLRVVQ